MPSLLYTVLPLLDMSDKKSPPRKEKPLFVRTPQSENKSLKRKILSSESPPHDEEDKKITPKRKKTLNSEISPPQGTVPLPKLPPSGITSPRTGPLSERQQMLILMRMTDENSQDSTTNKPASPQPNVPIPKKTPIDKKVHKRNERGETPLHIAAIRGDVKQIKKLIKAGADVNVADFAGWTPLHEACNRGWVQVAKQLLKAGANVNVQGLENDTPLHDAVINAHNKLVELLLKHGADPLQSNSKGKTPVDLAGSADMVKLLRKEIMSSSSDSSSLDDIRSPTSPESNSSLKEEDFRNSDIEDRDLITSRLVKSDGTYGYSGTQGPSSRRMLIPKTQESPRLFLKFHRETGDEVSDRQKDVTSYSVIMGMSDKHSFSPVDSNVSSVDSDLYDPQLESKSSKFKPGGDESDISSTNLLLKNNVTPSVINPDMDFQNFQQFNTLEPDSSQGMETSHDFFRTDMRKQETQPFNTLDSSNVSEVKVNNDSLDYIPNVSDPGHTRLKEDKSNNSSNHKTVSSSTTFCHSVTNNSINSVSNIVPYSTERTNTSSNSQNFSNFSRRNSISCNVVSSNVSNGIGPTVESGSESTVTTSGLKWDLRSASSPRVEEDSNLSVKSESDRVSSPARLDKDVRNSPRSDKEKDSRSCSPKVPPLKIIIPQKNSSSSSSDSESLKVHVSNKAALPYILNPGETTQVSTVTAVSTHVTTLLAQETFRPSSPGSSRPSSRGSNTASVTKDSEKVLKQVEDKLTIEYSGKIIAEESTEQEKDISKSKDEEKKEEGNQKSTRTLRSHTKEQQKLQERPKDKERNEKEKEKEREKDKQNLNEQTVRDDISVTSKATKNDEEDHQSSTLTRKRNLRQKTEPAEPPVVTLPPVTYEKPPNPYETYLAIRRQKITFQQKSLSVVQPKPPQGFKDYLLVNCSYVLQGNSASKLSVPLLSPPNSVTEKMRDLFIEQEKARYKLRLQHLTEREKLRLALEQEKIREHGRAARASSNQNLPLSVCTLMKYDEICNGNDFDQTDEKEKTSRSRYNGRQFLSWIKDVEDKFEKIKNALLLRHHNEAESLFAVQKMDWEWKMKECGLCDKKSVPVVEELHVPMVHVNDEFELLPS